MNLLIKKIGLLPFFFLAGFANGQVAQKETADALIIISRPIEMWSPDTSQMSRLLQITKEKRASFTYSEINGKRIGIFKLSFKTQKKHLSLML